ncbi:adhesion G-protein coupled receptor G4 [Aplysia californica]|uniref:Adhesion G-protein coupled receptor G4 n=1 Tax=Aplysia californica TaxID=6500 RepID=A0ABM1AAP7_APLCA|nr:adhesion G-protein coupled receptor G4 [Aplysia californica]
MYRNINPQREVVCFLLFFFFLLLCGQQLAQAAVTPGALGTTVAPAIQAPRQRASACDVNVPPYNDVCICDIGAQPQVRCMNVGLKYVPVNMLPKTAALSINGNQDFERIEEDDLKGQEHINTLFLQNNKISYIHPNAFRNLYKLRTLILENNQLTSLGDGLTYQHLPSLQRLSFQRNYITTVNKYSFITSFSTASTSVDFKFNSNAINCDCNIKGLAAWKTVAEQSGTNINIQELRCQNDPQNRLYSNVDNTVFGNCQDDSSEDQAVKSEESDEGFDDEVEIYNGGPRGKNKSKNENKRTIKSKGRKNRVIGRIVRAQSFGNFTRMEKNEQVREQKVAQNGRTKRKKKNRDRKKDVDMDSQEESSEEHSSEEESSEEETGGSANIFSDGSECYSCNKASTNYGCKQQSQGKQPCIGIPEMVCVKSVSWREKSKTMAISSRCVPYTMCLSMVANNEGTCGLDYQTSLDVDCSFCCIGPTCDGDNSIGGRTTDYSFNLVYVRVNAPFEPYMKDTNSQQYAEEELRIKTGILRDITSQVKGGFDVYVLRYEPEENRSHKVVLQIEVTVFNTESPNVVKSMLQTHIEQSNASPNGFLRKENINGQSMHFGPTFTGSEQCQREVTNTSKGSFSWPITNPGTITNLICPYQNPQSSEVEIATRACLFNSNQDGVWQVADESQCLEAPSTVISLDDLENRPITQGTADAVSQDLLDFVKDRESFSPAQMNKVVNILESLTRDDVIVQPGIANNVVETMDVLISADEDELKNAEKEKSTSKRLLGVIDKVGEKAPLSNGKLKIVSSNLAVAAQGVNRQERRSLLFSTGAKSGDDLKSNDVDVKFVSPTGNAVIDEEGAQIVFPTEKVLSQQGNVERVAFAAHKSEKLFASIDGKNEGTTKTVASVNAAGEKETITYIEKVNSQVVSASIPGVKSLSLPENVTLTFEHNAENATNPRCVFWDEDLTEDGGGWSDEGCSVVEATDGHTMCSCNHLTNFALLMDVYQEGSNLSDLDKKVLSIISYIGCGVSLFALLLTLITYSMFNQGTRYNLSDQTLTTRKLRRDNPSKILVNLCLALLFSNLVFLVGMQDYTFDSEIACKIVAVLLHYFLLSSLTWMAVEAFYMYLALVLVFKTYFTRFILKCALVGWGIPLVVVAITLGIDKTNNYGFVNTGLCWLRNPAFYAAFVGPVCLILLLNCAAFALVIRQLRSSSKLNKTDRNSTVQRLRGAIGVVILLGLTWIFAIFAIDRASVVFYYLFAIFNSLQGLFIFIFYCLLKKDAVAAWKRSLPCCEDYGDQSKTSSNSRVPGVTKKQTAVTTTRASPHTNKNAKHSDNSVDDSSMTASTSMTGSREYSVASINEDDSNGLYSTLNEPGTVTADTERGQVSFTPAQRGQDNPTFYSNVYDNEPKSQQKAQPGGPAYSSVSTSSNPNSPIKLGEGEVDSRNTASVSDIRLRFEKST